MSDLLTGKRGLEHSADPQEIDDVETYLRSMIPPQDESSSKA